MGYNHYTFDLFFVHYLQSVKMDELDENFDDYMGNNDILDYLPKSSELEGEDPDLFRLSVDGHEEEEIDMIPELPKFLANKVNTRPINLDSTMTTDQTNDENEEEFDEDELYIIDSLEKKQRREDREDRELAPAERQCDDRGNFDEEEVKQQMGISLPYRSSSPSARDTRSPTTSHNKSSNSDNFSAASMNKSQPLYQHEVSKPRFTAGRKQLSIAEAKLFGLLNEKGELIDLKSTSQSMKNDFATKKYLYEMATPKNVPSNAVDGSNEGDNEECTFAPKRSNEALKAMKNPRCGYDFMDRINNRGSFLDRVNHLASSSSGRKGAMDGGKPLSKTEYETMKQDYDSLLTKLQCPTCLKCQTFDEFLNKKRICTLCHVKFEKLNISSGLSFTKKNKEYEKKRLEKLAEIDKEMYGNIPRKDNHLLSVPVSLSSAASPSLSPPRPPLPSAGTVPSSSSPSPHHQQKQQQKPSHRSVLLKNKENLENSNNDDNDNSNANEELNDDIDIEEKKERVMQKNKKNSSSAGTMNQKDAMQKILSINQNNAKTLNQTLQHLFPSVTENSITAVKSNGDKREKKKYNADSGFPPISTPSSSLQHKHEEKTKTANRSYKVGNNATSGNKDSMTEKLERLLHV
jgi:hypothetical protein